MPAGVKQAVLLPSHVHFSNLVNIFLFSSPDGEEISGPCVFWIPLIQPRAICRLGCCNQLPDQQIPVRLTQPGWGPSPSGPTPLSSLSSVPVTDAASVRSLVASTTEQVGSLQPRRGGINHRSACRGGLPACDCDCDLFPFKSFFGL